MGKKDLGKQLMGSVEEEDGTLQAAGSRQQSAVSPKKSQLNPT